MRQRAETCQAMNGDEWPCGQWAANKLAEWIGQLTVTFETTRKDQYGRWLARCDVAGASIAWLVSHGRAVPYRDCKREEIRALSKDAEPRNAGIWAASSSCRGNGGRSRAIKSGTKRETPRSLI